MSVPGFSLKIFHLLKCAKRIRHKLMKSSPKCIWYLKNIPDTRRTHSIRYLHFYVINMCPLKREVNNSYSILLLLLLSIFLRDEVTFNISLSSTHRYYYFFSNYYCTLDKLFRLNCLRKSTYLSLFNQFSNQIFKYQKGITTLRDL